MKNSTIAHQQDGHRKLLATILIFVLLVTVSSPAFPCTRVLWSNNGQAVVVGRNMDWFSPEAAVDLYALPRGIERDGLTGKNTLKWKAKYGTVMAEGADGINEKGLTGSMLWLAESDYGTFDPSQPSLSVGQWLQFYLDNFANVEDLVEYTNESPFQIVGGEFDGKKIGVHLALADASGNSVIIEYLDGKAHIYEGNEYTVMTNSPTYAEQLENLKQYTGFGGDSPLPGTTEAADRFVRAAYYLNNLPKPENNREAIAGILSVMRNTSQPFGVPDPARPNISATRWRTVSDLTNLVYYFESATSPNLIWIKLTDLDFSEGSGIRKVDLKGNPDRIGDATVQMEPSEPYANQVVSEN